MNHANKGHIGSGKIMKIELIEKSKRLKGLQPQWEELLEKSPANDIFLTPAWFFSWWPVFKKNKQLFFLAFWQDHILIGLFPLYKIKKLFFNIITFSGSPVQADRMDMIIAENFEKECFTAFEQWIFGRKDWDIILLKDFAPLTSNASIFSKLLAMRGRKHLLSKDEPNYYITTSDFTDFEEYIATKLSRKCKHSYNNTRNKLKKVSAVVFEICKQLSMTNIESMENLSLKNSIRGSVGKSFFNIPENKKFLKNLIEHDQNNHNIQLCFYTIKNILVSYILIFSYNNKIGAYITATDKNMKKISIGSLVFFQCIKYGITNKYQEFDFLKGGEKYKTRFCNKQHIGSRMYVFQNNFSAKLLYSYYQWIKPMRKKVANNQKIWKFLPKGIRGKWDI